MQSFDKTLRSFPTLRFIRSRLHVLSLWPIVAVGISFVGWLLLQHHFDRQLTYKEKEALHTASVLSAAYADQLNRSIQIVDQILLHVRFEWEISRHTLRFETIQEKGLFPEKSSIFNVVVVDKDGTRVTASSPIPAPENPRSLADRPYFLALKASTSDDLYIGEHAVGAVSNQNLIRFARKLTGANGEFDGVVQVAVTPDFLSSIHDPNALGSNGLLALIGSDKVVRLTRTGPTVQLPGTSALLEVPELSEPQGRARLEGVRWFKDQRSRFVGWDTVEDYPLVAVVGLDQHDTMAPYWNERKTLVSQARWATALLIMSSLIAAAVVLSRAWRKHQFAIMNTTYRMATEGGNEGFYIGQIITDKHGYLTDLAILDGNARAAELIGLSQESLIGKNLTSLYTGNMLRRILDLLRVVERTGFYEGEIRVPANHAIRARWIHLRIARFDLNVAVTIRDVSDRKKHIAELERKGNEDVLTLLPNRHWLQTYLPQAIEESRRQGVHLAILFVDLDRFKEVNDTLGHAAGDELLRAVAKRLASCLRPQDKVTRYGGDEFVVILRDIVTKDEVESVARRILQAFRENVQIGQSTRTIGTSIGISLFPENSTEAISLLEAADVAMYSAKMSGRGNLQFFEPRFHAALRDRVQRELELRDAISEQQFEVYYQGRTDVVTGRTVSMEALVRWIHPSKGLISPVEFVPLAEETGLIVPLGELVLEKVCCQLSSWRAEGKTLIPISVNVSPRQFSEVDVPTILKDCLARYDLNAHHIEIELTESCLMEEDPATLSILQGMGIKLCIDDFGTGYSSLSQLQRLQFDVLKIDRAFTCEVDKTEQGRIFFTAIVTMAHALGMRVVAEGVENSKQVALLKSLDCDEAQGYFFSRPLPAHQVQLALVDTSYRRPSH